MADTFPPPFGAYFRERDLFSPRTWPTRICFAVGLLLFALSVWTESAAGASLPPPLRQAILGVVLGLSLLYTTSLMIRAAVRQAGESFLFVPFLLGAVTATLLSLGQLVLRPFPTQGQGMRFSVSVAVGLWWFLLLQQALLRQTSKYRLAKPSIRAGHSLSSLGRWLAGAIVIAGLAAGLGVLLFADPASVTVSGLVRFVWLLVAVSPISAIAATTLALDAAAARASASGVVFRSFQTLEKLARLNYLILDRRLLLHSHPEVVEVFADPRSPVSDTLLLQLAASIEQPARHPFARAIFRAAQARQLHLLQPEQFSELPGRGVAGRLGKQFIVVGNRQWLADKLVRVERIVEKADKLVSAGNSVLFVAVAGECVGLIAVADRVRADVKTSLAKAQTMNITLALFTGDDRRTAQKQADQLGLERVLAELPRTSLAKEIGKLKREARVVGLAAEVRANDSALNQADISIGVGAIDRFGFVPDVLLRNGGIKQLVDAIVAARGAVESVRGMLGAIVVYHLFLALLVFGAGYGLAPALLAPLLAAGLSTLLLLFVSWQSGREISAGI